MEMFDVVDENGVPTGETVSREKAHQEGIRHRTAHVWLVRKREGRMQVLLQKRSANKDSAPGKLDTSSAGHIPAGCDPVPSALRELKEELGVTAEAKELRYIGLSRVNRERVYHGKPFRINEVSWVYLLQREVTDDEFRLQEEEVESVCWQDVDTVAEAMAAKDPAYCVPDDTFVCLRRALADAL